VTTDSESTLAAIRVLANVQGHAEAVEWWRANDITKTAELIRLGQTIEAIGGPCCMPISLLSVVQRHATDDVIKASPQPVATFLRAITAAKFSAADAEEHVESFFEPTAKKDKTTELSARCTDFIEWWVDICFGQSPEVQIRVTGRRGEKDSKET
jgi:hypothetical protein